VDVPTAALPTTRLLAPSFDLEPQKFSAFVATPPAPLLIRWQQLFPSTKETVVKTPANYSSTRAAFFSPNRPSLMMNLKPGISYVLGFI
jgi:hypothetical protein